MSNLHFLKVKVVRIDEDRHKFIVEHEGKIYQVSQLAFQRQQPKPDFIDCIYSQTDNGGIYMSQNIQRLMQERYKIGDEVEFQIKYIKDDKFVLEDNYGFTALMNWIPTINSALTPRVKCQILNILQKNMEVRFISTLGAAASEFSLKDADIASIIGDCVWNTPALRTLVLSDSDIETFSTAFGTFLQHVVTSTTKEELPEVLSDIRRRSLAALASPAFLPKCTIVERSLLEQRFTEIIEQTGYCVQAMEKVDSGEAVGYVEDVLKTLSESAFIYHPRKHFGIILGIFMFDASVMQRTISLILSSLRSQPDSLWRRPPFQRQLLKILDLYVSRLYPENDKLQTDSAARETMISTLAIELMLAKNLTSPYIDLPLNLSTLYRLVSLMNVSEPEKTLNKAFLSLFTDADIDFSLPFDCDDAFIMANMLCSQIDDNSVEDFDGAEFRSGKTRLLVNHSSITLMPSTPPMMGSRYSALPSELKLWHGLGVELDEKIPSDLRNCTYKTIGQYKKLWEYLYTAVFSAQSSLIQSKINSLDIDDQTHVIIFRRIPGTLVFECKIVNDEVEGTGTLDIRTDCSPYYPGDIGVSTFEKDGKPLILDVYVKAINADGTYVFGMSEYITEFMEQYREEHLGYDSVLTCIVNKGAAGAKCVPAISYEGLSVSVSPSPDITMDDLYKGAVVEVDCLAKGTNGFIASTFNGYSDLRHISVAEAFHRLMVNYAGGEVYDIVTGSSAAEEEVRTMDKRSVRELMFIIDAKATIENDSVRAYNYLSYCRLIAKLLADDERINYYASRLRLLELLNEFAVSDSISLEAIHRQEENDAAFIYHNATLRHDFEQLQIIGCINKDDYYDYLYGKSLNNENPQLQQLASLVMAHNTVKKAGLLTQAGDILDKIRSLLKLDKNHSNKKNYGSEDFHTEFKTSIIYPESSMRVDIKAQRLKIMQEICAFLNAEGGTLYIGVSDIGYEMGIDEDLKHPLFSRSRDKYKVYVDNCVAQDLGQQAAHYVHSNFDNTIKGDVLIIRIEPCPTPIMVDGNYYERMGTSARCVNDTYRESFLSQRKAWAAQHQPQTDLPIEDASPAPIAEKQTSADSSSYDEAGEWTVQTSRSRNNILHEYDDYDNYLPVSAVISIMADGNYKVLDEDDYQPALLKIAVHEEEEDRWLVMVYDTGRVCRIPVSQLLKRDRDRIFKRSSAAEVVYASIGGQDDMLCLGLTDSKGVRYVRFDDLSAFGQGGMQDDGDCPVDCSFDSLFFAEIVPAVAAQDIRPTSRKSIGINLRSADAHRCLEAIPGVKAENLE